MHSWARGRGRRIRGSLERDKGHGIEIRKDLQLGHLNLPVRQARRGGEGSLAPAVSTVVSQSANFNNNMIRYGRVGRYSRRLCRYRIVSDAPTLRSSEVNGTNLMQ